MHAIRIHEYGGPEVLLYEEAPMPVIGPDDILIKVSATSVNPIDWKFRKGLLRERMPVSLPYIPGWDVAGIVEEVGSLVTGFKYGDKVYARNSISRNGAYAEYVAVRASDVAFAPGNISLIEAAAVPLACMTAWAGLFEQGSLRQGQGILIHGGSGGVGTFAIQLAKLAGAIVATTTSTRNVELMKKLGADIVIDYTKDDFSKKLKDLDFVFDTVGGETQKKSWEIIKPGGTLVSTVGADEAAAKEHGVTAKSYMLDSNGARLQEITGLINRGKLKIVIEKKFSLADARKAHELSEQGHARGKIVLEVRAD